MLEKKIAGYSNEISVAPGERIRFMVSCEPGIDRYQADIVRLYSGDRQPGGPGYRDELLPSPVSGEYPRPHARDLLRVLRHRAPWPRLWRPQRSLPPGHHLSHPPQPPSRLPHLQD